jgi:hypothetical protein
MCRLTGPEEYLRRLSAEMIDRYRGDCLKHARQLQALLRGDGRSPWLGRLRKVEKREAATFHAPLIPARFLGRAAPTWTTHYVCCCDGRAYDPLVGVPIPLERYSVTVFGEDIEITRLEPDSHS